MEADDLWRIIEAERLDTVRLLDGLTAEEWDTPSLCAGWTVRTVAGHLLLSASVAPSALTWAVIRHGGVARAVDKVSRQLAERPVPELLASLRAAIGDQSLPSGAGPGTALVEAVVHGFDLRVPLGRSTDRPAAAVTATLDVLVSERSRSSVPTGRADGLQLVATDLDWRHGTGPEVHGPAWAVAVALAGRTVGLAALAGDGAATLAARLAASR